MENPVNDFVCASIRKHRMAQGLRVVDMAQRTGIPLGSYSCLETGRYRMSLENLFRIIHVLGVEIAEVWPRNESGTRSLSRDLFTSRAAFLLFLLIAIRFQTTIESIECRQHSTTVA